MAVTFEWIYFLFYIMKFNFTIIIYNSNIKNIGLKFRKSQILTLFNYNNYIYFTYLIYS
jgi:hypothetical protein